MKNNNLKKSFLTEAGLMQLKGGEVEPITNENTMPGCECTYFNRPSLTNSNSVYNCKCTCIL